MRKLIDCFLELSPFQLQTTASVRERPLLVTWATIAAPALHAAAIREPTLLFVNERGFRHQRPSSSSRVAFRNFVESRKTFLSHAREITYVISIMHL